MIQKPMVTVLEQKSWFRSSTTTLPWSFAVFCFLTAWSTWSKGIVWFSPSPLRSSMSTKSSIVFSMRLRSVLSARCSCRSVISRPSSW